MVSNVDTSYALKPENTLELTKLPLKNVIFNLCGLGLEKDDSATGNEALVKSQV